ncbi:unnamed protein product [Thelazia callipaeda]|uniref:MFS domain-containing protein n=1 Tax=Thelazia callipaeda TaxID=103827 RepID=A0A0N5CVZ4_THECL|nr:unnamed protein product [Thelazia callipaeda]
MFFVWSFYLLLVICIIQYLYTRSKVSTNGDAKFRQFQIEYLLVYLLAVAGDWLQGPHVYALYDSYGMTKHEIELLFVAGFASSLIFGTFIASIADKYGRRSNCLLYSLLYGVACITIHFSNFWILTIGRIFSGISTSVLCSAFESWLIFEHNKRGFSKDLLSTVFSHAALGNSVVAIICGVIAQYAADIFGYVAPFDVSLAVLIMMAFCAMFCWTENYGSEKVILSEQFINAFNAIKNGKLLYKQMTQCEKVFLDQKILCLGLIQSLFEGAMYMFVLQWTPSLSDAYNGMVSHGYIFASFMVAVMIGSTIFRLIIKYQRPDSFLRFVLLLSAFCLITPTIWPKEAVIIFVAFILFEICIGIFWPAMGVMRGIYIHENTRATIMNFCRIPLNIIVIIILLQNLSRQNIFYCCAVFMVFASIIQQYLFQRFTLSV